VSVYRFIAAERVNHRVKALCRVLRVSRSGFYAWSTRPPSRRDTDDRSRTRLIHQIHEGSRGTYGAPRIWVELRLDHGVFVSRKRVARLMRAARLQGVHVRRRYRTTRVARGVAPAPDLVDRRFAAAAPDRIWVADITYLETLEGYLHLAAIEDLFSRAIVGWSMATHLRAGLVVDAFDMAHAMRHPGPGSCTIPTEVPKADSGGRRNTSIEEVLHGPSARLVKGSETPITFTQQPNHRSWNPKEQPPGTGRSTLRRTFASLRRPRGSRGTNL
jgi:hypothetical protein